MAKVEDRNGFWFIEKNPITKVGVYPYLGKQISTDCQPNKIYYVLRPKEELFKQETLDSLRLIPIVNNHTMIGTGFTAPEDKGIDGILGDDVSHDTDTIYNDLKIMSNKMKDDIKNGKKELSLGYFCRYEYQPGIYKGQRYDYVQRDIKANHLALVDKGRMGADVRVYDSKDSGTFAMDSIDISFDFSDKVVNNKTEYKNKQGEKEMAEKQKKEQPVLDEDKRKIIDEIGGILKDKVSEEDWRTIVGKIEKVAYNGSEAGKGTDEDDKGKKEEGKDEDKEGEKTEDKCGKDEGKKDGEGKKETEKKDKEEKKGMDEADIIKMFARKEKLGKEVEEVLGTFDHEEMTELEIAKYACDKLELAAEQGQEIATIKGYLKGVEKNKKIITYSQDKAETANGSDKAFDNFVNKK